MTDTVTRRRCGSVSFGLFAGLLLICGSGAWAAPRAPFENTELRARIGGYWTMRLTARDGVWEPVIRSKPSFTFVDHGYITAADGSQERFKVSMRLQLDGGTHPRGNVFYDIDLQRQSDGAYKGTFVETGAESTSTGEVTAVIEPPQVYSVPGHVPVQRDEFPRLLLRTRDIPALRARLKTPFGQAFLARAEGSKDPVVLGVLYQATGETKYAEEAMKIIAGMGDIDANGRLSGEFGHTIVKVALTVDLCYNGWPAEFRTAILKQIKARLPKRMHVLLGEAPNYNQVSNYYGPSLGSTGIATLLLYGSKGAEPSAPVKPLCVLYPDCRVPPVTGYQPPQGVPVVPLENDKLPKDWIYAGGFTPAAGADLLAPLGGAEKARPSLSDSITDGKTNRRFKVVSHEQDQGYFFWHDQNVIDVSSAIGRLYHTESYFYTVIQNDQPGWYEFNIGPDHQESFTYLNGVPIEEGHVVQLDKGLYTVLIKVRIGQTEPWGREMLAARFTLLKDKRKRNKTVDEINATIRARYDQAVKFHETEVAEWKARNEEDLESLRLFLKGREQMFQHYRFGVGDGGFTAEATHYGNIAVRYPMLYAACYRNAFGRDVSTHPDTTLLLPRQMMQACFSGATPVMMNLSVKAHFDAEWCAGYFPLVPDKFKPHLLWGWNKVMNVEFDKAAALDRATADKMMKGLDGTTLASTFVNYPTAMDPVHPSKGMPLTWAADTLGFYVFRSGWEGKDEFIAQVFSKSIPIRAWNHPNCGAFRLWGLGRPWTSAPIERSGYRPEESVVQLPDDVTNEGACGKVVHYVTRPDGSGAMVIDMDDVYLAVKEEKPKKTVEEKAVDDIEDIVKETKTGKTDFGIGDSIKDAAVPKAVQDFYREKDRDAIRAKLPKIYNGYGERIAGVNKTSDVTGGRSFAFDYSGASGAPCLMVMLDSIRGGHGKQWLWHLPTGDGWKAQAKDNTFIVKYPDVSLKATFVSPSPVNLKFMLGQKMSFIYRGGSAGGQLITREYDFMAAESAEKDVDFMLVVTIQRGEAPPVQITGAGAGVVATVGNRKVRRDGMKIVIE